MVARVLGYKNSSQVLVSVDRPSPLSQSTFLRKSLGNSRSPRRHKIRLDKHSPRCTTNNKHRQASPNSFAHPAEPCTDPVAINSLTSLLVVPDVVHDYKHRPTTLHTVTVLLNEHISQPHILGAVRDHSRTQEANRAFHFYPVRASSSYMLHRRAQNSCTIPDRAQGKSFLRNARLDAFVGFINPSFTLAGARAAHTKCNHIDSTHQLDCSWSNQDLQD